jgi:glycosyltransferase involved in cell wall biosynthesis
MKIAIDGGPLSSGDSVRGIGTYTRELLKAMNLEGVDVSKSDLTKFDVVHFTRFNPFFISVPWTKPKNTKFILTIYDLIPLIYPKHYPAGIRGKLKFLINKYLIKKNIDAIITISETSKKDICRFLGVNPSKVHVAYLAPRSIFKRITNHQSLTIVQKKYGLPNSFALYVGDVNYNKNIPNLLAACNMAKIPLVIVGKQAKEIEKMDLAHPELTHLVGLDWSGSVRLGFVPVEELVEIYNLASVYVQPSFYEGFGLPLLEAIACGTPVVIAKTQALVEIIGKDAVYVNPNDPKDMAASILNPNRDTKLPRNYSWKITASETQKIYSK